MKTTHRTYIVLCIGIGIWMQHGTAHPDVFLGFLYGLCGSWIGPGFVVAYLAEMHGSGKIGVPAILLISALFWGAWFALANRAPRPRRHRAPAPVLAVPQPEFISWRRTTRTYTEE